MATVPSNEEQQQQRPDSPLPDFLARFEELSNEPSILMDPKEWVKEQRPHKTDNNKKITEYLYENDTDILLAQKGMEIKQLKKKINKLQNRVSDLEDEIERKDLLVESHHRGERAYYHQLEEVSEKLKDIREDKKYLLDMRSAFLLHLENALDYAIPFSKKKDIPTYDSEDHKRQVMLVQRVEEIVRAHPYLKGTKPIRKPKEDKHSGGVLDFDQKKNKKSFFG